MAVSRFHELSCHRCSTSTAALRSQPACLPDHVINAVVQGCPDSTDVDDALADAMSYVTVFPHPCTHGLSLQGFHFKYASIQGQISQPLFAFIPPCTLMVHSSKGIQFLKLKQYAMPLIPNPNCSLRNIQTAQQLSQHSMALQGAAADSAAVLSQPGMTNWRDDAAGASVLPETAALMASNCCHCNQALHNGSGDTAESGCVPEGPVICFQCTQLGHGQTACCSCHPVHHTADIAELSVSGSVCSPRHAHYSCPLPAAASEKLCTGQADTFSAAAQPAFADDDAQVLQEHHASTWVSDQQAAVAAVQPSSVQAKPAHSVWSMSASSDSLSSHQTPSCPDVSSVAKPMAGRDAPGTDADKYRRQLPDGAHVEGLSHFHTSISLRRGNDDIGFAPAVTAELMGPAFDPEKFIMGCIPHDKLNRHRLVDYTVQQVLCGDDTDRLTYGSPKCRGSSCSLSTQAGRGWSLEARACTDAAWAIVLIAAVFQPRSGAAQETVKPVALAVNICSSSGTGELLSEEWMDAAKFQQLVVNLRFFPKAYTMQQADLQRVAIVTSAECLAGKLKLKHSIPTSPHMRPVVLNNRAMLSSGRSAGLLTHPLLPICILGYGQHGNT
ncbi:TPA: hypothetical protein ACH3X1_005680 [Trebouxia sp. C0004]